MNVLKTALLAVALLFAIQGSAFAQDAKKEAGAAAEVAPVVPSTQIFDLRSIGAGLVVFGGAIGIGILAKSAVESQARQPEMAGRIQTTMIIAAALIEGFTFFALAIIFIAVNQGK